METKYDYSALTEFFNTIVSPAELAEELAQLAFNYASTIREGDITSFQTDMDTIGVLRNALLQVKPQ